jgi:hypothetical protein
VEGATTGSRGDPRAAIVVAGLLLLAAVVGVVLFSKGSPADLGAPPPGRCLSLWNADPKAIRYGAHNFVSHGYTGAEILFIDAEGNAARRGSCAVVFPAASLDPEPVAAVKVHRGGAWVPLSKVDGVSTARLAKLQADAISRNNAVLHEDGSLEPFS